MKTLDELRDLAIRWALDYISHHQAQSRVSLDGIGSGLATAQRFEEESKRALDDALRELIADAERWRYWRNLWPALTLMEVARFARLDLTRTYVDSPEKMDEVTDAARKG